MPQKSWAVGEEVLAADFNNYVQNQVVPVFASTAERDAQWPAPPQGAMCVVLSVTYQRVGSQWYPLLSRVAYISRTTNGPSAAAESIVLTSPAFTFPSSRLVRVQAGWRNAGVNTAGEAIIIRLREGTSTAGTQIADSIVNLAPSGPQVGTGSGGIIAACYTPAAGTKQWILTTASTTANPVNINGQAGSPIWLSVTDEGSA